MSRIGHLITTSVLIVILLSRILGQNIDCQVSHKIGNSYVNGTLGRKCTFKLTNQQLSGSTCQIVEYPSESEECNVDVQYSSSLPHLHLKYNHDYEENNDYPITVIFSEMKWTNLTLNLKVFEENKHVFCQDFNLLSNAKFSDSSNLHCACPFVTEENEDKTFDITLTAVSESHKQSRRLLFKLPSSKHNSLNTRNLFVYMDITNAPDLQIRWQTAPKQFGVNSYIIKTINFETDEVLATNKVYATPDQDELLYNITPNLGTHYYFIIEMEHASCHANGCASRSPHIDYTFPSAEGKTSGFPLTYANAIGSAIVAIIFMILFVWWASIKPVVLIIYKRTLPPHTEAVLSLAEYMKEHNHIDAKIDEFDIPASNVQNPIMWCQQAFREAKFVMVISSPPRRSNYEPDLYHDVAGIGLELIAENLNNKKKRNRYFSVILPYCEQKDIPSEAVDLKCFTLTEDYDEMLRFIHHVSRRKYKVPGGLKHLPKKGMKLLEAFENAKEAMVRLNQERAELGTVSDEPHCNEFNKLLPH